MRASFILIACIAYAQSPVRINCAGPAYTDPTAIAWQADEGYSGSTATFAVTHAITGTATPAIYQKERYGLSPSFTYTIPFPNGAATVTLHESENWFVAAGSTGLRTFNVAINGTPMVNNWDIYADVGAYAAETKTFPVTVTDGTVGIVFTSGANNAKIDAIEIVPSVTPPNIGPPGPMGPQGPPGPAGPMPTIVLGAGLKWVMSNGVQTLNIDPTFWLSIAAYASDSSHSLFAQSNPKGITYTVQPQYTLLSYTPTYWIFTPDVTNGPGASLNLGPGPLALKLRSAAGIVPVTGGECIAGHSCLLLTDGNPVTGLVVQ